MYASGANNRIYGANHFTWSEAIPSNSKRPTSSDVLQRIIRLANYLESVRTKLGDKPIIITSWYRSPEHNARVGGAKNSRHISGDAVDFYCNHISIKAIYKALDEWHGNQGGLGLYNSHIHLDIRGYHARWSGISK